MVHRAARSDVTCVFLGFHTLLVFALTRKGRVETRNYRTVKLPTGMDLPVFLKDRDEFATLYQAMFTRQETADRSNIQGRYMLRQPWEGGGSCAEVAQYRQALAARRGARSADAGLVDWLGPADYPHEDGAGRHAARRRRARLVTAALEALAVASVVRTYGAGDHARRHRWRPGSHGEGRKPSPGAFAISGLEPATGQTRHDLADADALVGGDTPCRLQHIVVNLQRRAHKSSIATA
ncbi:MAG: hypothetical protein QGI10_15200 [Vicinamibacterales bacterium]|nr:hypothetical protein [Vicinamibacterales bacterium]MDP7690870.1 hypothetical protein [Vicinamibacterales bacterium]